MNSFERHRMVENNKKKMFAFMMLALIFSVFGLLFWGVDVVFRSLWPDPHPFFVGVTTIFFFNAACAVGAYIDNE